jgi:hypothetical protein
MDQSIYKINTVANDTLFVRNLPRVDGAAAGEISVTDRYIPFAWTVAAVSDRGVAGTIDLYLLQSDPRWLTVQPDSCVNPPEGEVHHNLVLSAVDVESGDYEAELNFLFPEIRSSAAIPVTMRVLPLRADAAPAEPPGEFGIAAIFPDPFNNYVTIHYSLPKAEDVTLTIVDCLGRSVMAVEQGWRAAGRYSVNLNAADWATGLYFAVLESPRERRIAKLVLCK